MIGTKVLFNLYTVGSTAPEQYVGIIRDKYLAVDNQNNVIHKYLVSVEDVLFTGEAAKPLEKGSVTSLQPSSISEIISQ